MTLCASHAIGQNDGAALVNWELFGVAEIGSVDIDPTTQKICVLVLSKQLKNVV